MYIFNYVRVMIVTNEEIKCAECNGIFIFRSSEREYYSLRRIPEPKYCPICRRNYHKKMRQKEKIQEDTEWRLKKEKEFQEYIEDLKSWNVVSLAGVEPTSFDNTLYVIGNGFDLMHGAKSSYYDFSKTIGKNSYLRFCLENYLKVDDLWADFESALAKINVEMMCSPLTMDLFLDAMGAYDDDAGAAEFFAAAEMAAGPITEIDIELKKRFRTWICSLKTNTDDRPLNSVIKQGKVLNFNYTGFIEEMYGVDEGSICYIHGCRRKKKGAPREELILGHMPGDSDSEYEFEDNYSGIQLTGNRAQMIYDAQQTAFGYVVDADNNLTKDCDMIINNHKDFFDGLSEINRIITIGHSLYPVDWDYFREIINNNHSKEKIKWYFGCHGKYDLERIGKFVEYFEINKDNVCIFRTDTIKVTLNTNNDITDKKDDKIPKAKGLGSSDDGKWEVVCCNGTVSIYDKLIDKKVFSRIFSTNISGCIFGNNNTCLFLVARGLYAGVFLLRIYESDWRYVREIEGIPNQGVINKRLRRIILEDNEVTFVYNSRIRKYDTNNGNLILNKQVQRAFEHDYGGEDLTDKFRKIYRGVFY